MSRVEKVNLTDAKIRALKPPTDKRSMAIWDKTQPNFGLRIMATSGTVSYIVRVKKQDKARQETIGKFDPFEFAKEGMPSQTEIAREKARLRAKQLTAVVGANPQEVAQLEANQIAEQNRLDSLAAEQAAVEAMTLSDVKELYVKDSPLRPATVTAYSNCMSEWDDRPVTEITIADCREWFATASKETPIKANREMQYLRALLNFIREEHADEKTGEYTILPINVVTRAFKKGAKNSWNKKSVSKTRIHKSKIGEVFNELERLSDQKNKNNTSRTTTSADLILFLLLTGCRVGEARCLEWDNVNLNVKVPTFTLKADTVKTGEELTLPISNALATVLVRRLAARRRNNNYVFPATTGDAGFVTDPRKLFIKISVVAGSHIHPHSLRRTYVDIAKQVHVDSGERRILLNHKVARDVHDDNYENDDDPQALLPSVNKIGAWVLEQGRIARGENVVSVEFAQ